MSGMSTALTSLQSTAQSMAKAANNLAKGPQPFRADPGDEETRLKTLEAPEAVREAQAPGPKETGSDLAVDAMNFKTDRVTYEANLQFMQVQSGLLGTALDMKA